MKKNVDVGEILCLYENTRQSRESPSAEVERVIWNDGKYRAHCDGGHAYLRTSFESFLETELVCTCLGDLPNGPRDSFYLSKNKFSFDEASDYLRIDGKKNGRKYSVHIYFKGPRLPQD